MSDLSGSGSGAYFISYVRGGMTYKVEYPYCDQGHLLRAGGTVYI